MFYALATRPATTLNRAATPVVGNSPVDRFLSDTFSSFADNQISRSVNVEDLENAYTLQLDVPGVPKEHLDIGIEGDVVRINSKEGSPRQVKAAWRFPIEIDQTNSSAKLENGVLTVKLAKPTPVDRSTRIAVH